MADGKNKIERVFALGKQALEQMKKIAQIPKDLAKEIKEAYEYLTRE